MWRDRYKEFQKIKRFWVKFPETIKGRTLQLNHNITVKLDFSIFIFAILSLSAGGYAITSVD